MNILINHICIPSVIQISEAFKRFGICDGDDSVMVVLVHSKDESQILSDVTARVNGRQVPVEDVSSLSDHAKIKKVLRLCFKFMTHSIQVESCGLSASFQNVTCACLKEPL